MSRLALPVLLLLVAGCAQHPAAPAVVMRDPSPDYPLTACVVSGKPLDWLGNRVAADYQGTEVQLCCRTCLTRFREDPPRYLAREPGSLLPGVSR